MWGCSWWGCCVFVPCRALFWHCGRFVALGVVVLFVFALVVAPGCGVFLLWLVGGCCPPTNPTKCPYVSGCENCCKNLSQRKLLQRKRPIMWVLIYIYQNCCKKSIFCGNNLYYTMNYFRILLCGICCRSVAKVKPDIIIVKELAI